MLQRLENLFLTILRLVVIVAAGLMLVAVVLCSLNAVKGLKSEPVVTQPTPKVVFSDLKKAVTEAAKASDAQVGDAASADGTLPTAADPNLVFYQRAAKAADTFVSSVSHGEHSVHADQFIAYLKKRAEIWDKDGLTKDYASQLADAMEHLAQDSQMAELVQQTSVKQVFEGFLSNFDSQFSDSVDAKRKIATQQQEQYLATKAQAQQSIYYAGGAFGAFLVIVFLSIGIRIERNLRNLERLKTPVSG